MVTDSFPASIVHQSLEVNDRLANLGLSQDPLWDALRAGLHYMASLTEYNTTAIRGMGVWDAINRVLGEELRPLGWIRREPGNFAITVHPSEEWCVAVLAGDGATGQHHMLASNRNPFGGMVRKRTRKAVSDNSVAVGRQSHFSGIAPSAWRQPPPMLTYFLVHHIDSDNRLVRAELSLPTYLPGAFITDWHERILLPIPTDLSPSVDFAPPQDSHSGDEIDIKITEKVS